MDILKGFILKNFQFPFEPSRALRPRRQGKKITVLHRVMTELRRFPPPCSADDPDPKLDRGAPPPATPMGRLLRSPLDSGPIPAN